MKEYKPKKYAVLSSIEEHFPADAVDRIKSHAVRLKLRGELPDEVAWNSTNWSDDSAHTWIITRARQYAKEQEVNGFNNSEDFNDHASNSLGKLLDSKNGEGKSVVLKIDQKILEQYGVPGNWIVRKDSVTLIPSLLVESHLLARDLVRKYAVSNYKPAVERRKKIASARAILKLAGFGGRKVEKELAEDFDPQDDSQFSSNTLVELRRYGSACIDLEYQGDSRLKSQLTLTIAFNPESTKLRGRNCHKLTSLLRAVAELNK